MKSTTISALFDSKNRRFEIPSYQRAYSWEKKQVNQFIEDLKTADDHYYLGHFLFESREDNTRLVIDGQQRLTTCIIFFSTIKSELEKRREAGDQFEIDLNDISDYYLKDIRKDTQKFKTVAYDNNFFLDEVVEPKKDNPPITDTHSQTRIRTTKEMFEAEFSKITTEDLIKWCKFIENAEITEYVVNDKILAAQVFAFQNDRGIKLSNLEVIKAYCMLQVYKSKNQKEKNDEDIAYLEIELSKIFKQIARISIDEDEVLNYYWRAVSGKGFNSEEVIPGIKAFVASSSIDKGVLIKQFFSGLSQAFNTIEIIERSADSYTQDLRYLKNMALAYPFIIQAYRLNVNEKPLRRLIKVLENITFRYLLRGGRAEIESRLNEYLVHFNSADDVDQIVNGIICKLKTDEWWNYWNDESMVSLLNGHMYQNRVDNYLLWKYELFLCDINHPKPHQVSFEDLIRKESIEHIAPVTPTDGSPVENGYGVYEDVQHPENGIVSGNWLNCVGNLMLISQAHNSAIGNKPFKDKIESYGRDNLLNQQKEIGGYVADISNPTWDKQAIEKRKVNIVTAAKQIWNMDNI